MDFVYSYTWRQISRSSYILCIGKIISFYSFSSHTVPLNYNYAWQHYKYLNNPVTWLHGPHFLMAWNIHVSCNSSCATCGIVMHGIFMCGIIMRGTGHARNSHEWNTCRHKCAINIRYSSAINLQKHVEFSSQL